MVLVPDDCLAISLLEEALGGRHGDTKCALP
jgi:hypothetical protein